MRDFLKKELTGVFNIPKPAIGIDVDGTIDQAPEFFSVLTNTWPGDIHIITMRSHMDELLHDLRSWNVKHTHIHLVDKFSDKGKIIDEHKLVMFFDDMPEVLQQVGEQYNVCLIRNEGNFNHETSKYIMSEKTAEII